MDIENVIDALKTLRTEIAPLCSDDTRLRKLSSCILRSPSNCKVNGTSNSNSSRKKSRSKLLEDLQNLFPATVMLSERRSENLVEQALSLQRDSCRFHNTLDQEMSLYVDHQCGKCQIPSHTLQVNGESQVSLKHKLYGHQKSVSFVSWSPNDNQLLTCGVEGTVRRWDVATGECLHVNEKEGLGLLSCGWSPSGEKVFCGVTDKSISTWDLNGKELDVLKGKRTLLISDLEVMSDGKWVISICRENVIVLYNMETKAEEFIEETQTIISFSLSADDKFLLVNLCNQEMHLWNLRGDMKPVANYEGYKRTRLLIRSCLGGLEQGFIASGSEDSQVYIWHRDSRELIEVLPGHSASVNCVSWNPTNPHMLASVSDDRTIRIWGLNAKVPKQKSLEINGNHYCNGTIKK